MGIALALRCAITVLWRLSLWGIAVAPGVLGQFGPVLQTPGLLPHAYTLLHGVGKKSNPIGCEHTPEK